MGNLKYNSLAQQIRKLRQQVEGWDDHTIHGRARSHAQHKSEYEDLYKDSQWQAHKWHLEHVNLARSQARSSGLREARPFLPHPVYAHRRRVTRSANAVRHLDDRVVDRRRWVPKGTLDASDSSAERYEESEATSSTELSFG